MSQQRSRVAQPFKCSLCPFSFNCKGSLESHQLVHTDARPYECPLCGAAFKTFHCLKRHHRLKHLTAKKRRPRIKSEKKNLRPVDCPICGLSLHVQGALTRHLFQVHDPRARQFRCSRCLRPFSSVHSLSKHIAHVHADPSFKCGFCAQAFKTAYSRDLHFKMVHSDRMEKRYNCPHCPRACMRQCDLRYHMRRVHSDIKPYACKLCPAQLKDKAIFSLHMELHRVGNDRPHSCSACGANFKLERDVKRHFRSVHLNLDLSCRQCSKVFKSRVAYRTHVKTKHELRMLKVAIGCAQCGVEFTEKHSLSRHIATAHVRRAKEFGCSRCGSSFFDHSSLVSHMWRQHLNSAPKPKEKDEPARCGRCLKVVSSRTILKRHLAYMHQLIPCDVACPNCPAMLLNASDLRHHEQRFHGGVMPFKCEHCPERFNRPCRLRRHLQRAHSSKLKHY